MEAEVETRAGHCSSSGICSNLQLICVVCSEPGKVLGVMYSATNKTNMALLYTPVKEKDNVKMQNVLRGDVGKEKRRGEGVRE